MKKSVLVTLADEGFIDQAKQLFSSVYFNSGWKGDYLLLAHKIPEEKLEWFRKKGIIVKSYKGLTNKKIKIWPNIVFSKLYMFAPEFKRWDNIVFLDADMIVRSSIDELVKVRGFAAFPSGVLSARFDMNDPKTAKLKKRYNFKGRAFGGGIMAFSSDVIREDTFSKFNDMLKKYDSALLNEEAILNIHFYKNYKKIPEAYNVSFNFVSHLVKPDQIKGIIMHFARSPWRQEKPWSSESRFYGEWKRNLDKADLIDLEKRLPSRKIWSKRQVNKYSAFLRRKHLYHDMFLEVDRHIGLVGIFLRKHVPWLYKTLKRIF